MSRRRVIPLLFVFILIFGLAWPSLSTTLTDWWWFQEIGYQIVFTREISARLWLFLGVGVFSALFFFINLRIPQRGMILSTATMQIGPNAVPFNVSRILHFLTWPVSVVMGLFFGAAASGSWDTMLQAWYRTPFGNNDPIFGRDIGYYVFTLPALQGIFTVVFMLLILNLIFALPMAKLCGKLIVDPPRSLHLLPPAARHIGTLLVLLFVLIALQLWFQDIPSLVYSTHALMVGANFTDLHASMPAMKVSALFALIAAATIGYGAYQGHLGRYTVRAIAGYILIAFLGRGVLPTVMQKFFVAPTELTRESQYLQYHIAATRAAWGLDSVETRELDDGGNLSLADIRNNGPTIDNVRLWDRDPLLQTFGQLQEIRTYYDFESIDDDRYWIDGKYRQVLLSPRELQIASLQSRNFINEHLTFTHGMGLTLGPVNQVTSDGLPVLFIKDLPPVSSVSLKVTRPQIYYGEIDYNYAVVGTKEKEFDHPAGEGDAYAAYAGTGGVRIGSFMRRAMLATRFAASNLLFSDNINDDSRVLYYRSITKRVAKALPFLTFDHDPYMVLADDGTLKWILDGYTSTSAYPYSRSLNDGTSYLRNSVKVVIDAYDGSVVAYLSNVSDPLIQTWAKIFPGIFKSFDSMPKDIRAHLRYPDELFRAQTSLYAIYHLDTPSAFYSREDQWQIPVVAEADGSVPFMRHIIMRLPGEKEAEFVYMVPFTPRGKENLASWLVARNDGAEYGKLRVYTLSRQSLVFGPTQVTNLISQNTEVSQQVSLWDQHGSKVLKGDLLVIPIERSLLYVEPLYLQAEGGRIPELKRVVVAYQNQVVMAETLDGALAKIFGGAPTTTNPTVAVTGTTSTPDASVTNIAVEAQRHFDNAMTAQREGNWAKYGEEIKAVGDLLAKLRNPPATVKRP